MADINLLPQSLSSNPSTVKLAKKINSYVLAEVVILLIVIAASFGGYLFYNNQIDESTSRVNELKRQVSSQESSEQRLILIKDRVVKARKILAKDTAIGSVNQLDLLLDIIPTGVEIVGVSLVSGRLDVEFNASSTTSLTNLLQLIMTGGNYSSVEMVSLAFSPSGGYVLVLGLYL